MMQPDRVIAVFEEIARTRMTGLPIVNPALRVELFGWLPWRGHRLAVLLTPWSMGLLLVADEEELPRLALDQRQEWDFPSGCYEFMGLNEAGLGSAQWCPLLSPLQDFTCQDEVRAVAQEVLLALLAMEQDDAARDAERGAQREHARLHGLPTPRPELSRRDFLRGAFLGD